MNTYTHTHMNTATPPSYNRTHRTMEVHLDAVCFHVITELGGRAVSGIALDASERVNLLIADAAWYTL